MPHTPGQRFRSPPPSLDTTHDQALSSPRLTQPLMARPGFPTLMAVGLCHEEGRSTEGAPSLFRPILLQYSPLYIIQVRKPRLTEVR